MSEPSPTPARAPLLSPRIAKLLAIAFGVGLLLFLLLWLDQRRDNDFFKAGGPTTGSGEIETLPAPLPADVAVDGGNASGLSLPRADERPTTEQPRIVDEPIAPPPPPVASPSPAAPPAVADSDSPVPISRPAPRYPQEALSRNIGGVVRVQAVVAADGSVERMEVAGSSGNRYLDRAAMDAVRRWRFKPAVRNGQAVTATVIVPLEFNPGR